MYKCSSCKKLLPAESFHRNGAVRFGLSLKCKKCTREYDKQYYRKNRQKILANKKEYYKGNKEVIAKQKAECAYGLTADEYDYMKFVQDGKCAICDRPPEKKSLSVDHCHETGEIRGLLCGRCNTALGSFQDSPDILRSAISYLGES